MNKVVLIVIVVLMSLPVLASNMDISEVRTLYFEGWIGECGANELVQLLSSNAPTDPVMSAYYGASIATTANCKTWPLQKLSAFNEGKKIIENAVDSDSDNIEIRFIRFTIQSNIPSLLNYNDMEEDKKFILERLNLQASSGVDLDLTKRILNYMISSGELTPGEKQNLTNLIVNNR
ncbi:MAG: hypothetical protein R2750_06510 [Bacteroidales bacterium]